MELFVHLYFFIQYRVCIELTDGQVLEEGTSLFMRLRWGKHGQNVEV